MMMYVPARWPSHGPQRSIVGIVLGGWMHEANILPGSISMPLFIIRWQFEWMNILRITNDTARRDSSIEGERCKVRKNAGKYYRMGDNTIHIRKTIMEVADKSQKRDYEKKYTRMEAQFRDDTIKHWMRGDDMHVKRTHDRSNETTTPRITQHCTLSVCKVRFVECRAGFDKRVRRRARANGGVNRTSQVLARTDCC
jgi:hypothetical protein